MYTPTKARRDHGQVGEEVRPRSFRLSLSATKAPEFIDITDKVRECVETSGVMNGCVVVFSRHTTAAIKINENEPLLLEDMAEFLTNLARPDGKYRHNDFSIRTVNMNDDECPNGHAHIQHLFLSTSENVPIIGGQVQLGRWQRVFLVELDHPRQREVLVQVIGA